MIWSTLTFKNWKKGNKLEHKKKLQNILVIFVYCISKRLHNTLSFHLETRLFKINQNSNSGTGVLLGNYFP
jgi:hypothetical protein